MNLENRLASLLFFNIVVQTWRPGEEYSSFSLKVSCAAKIPENLKFKMTATYVNLEFKIDRKINDINLIPIISLSSTSNPQFKNNAVSQAK